MRIGPRGSHTLNLDSEFVCETWSAGFGCGPNLPIVEVDFKLNWFLSSHSAPGMVYLGRKRGSRQVDFVVHVLYKGPYSAPEPPIRILPHAPLPVLLGGAVRPDQQRLLNMVPPPPPPERPAPRPDAEDGVMRICLANAGMDMDDDRFL